MLSKCQCLNEAEVELEVGREKKDEDGDGSCGCIIGSVQCVVLGVILTTKARGECYRLSCYLLETSLYHSHKSHVLCLFDYTVQLCHALCSRKFQALVKFRRNISIGLCFTPVFRLKKIINLNFQSFL